MTNKSALNWGAAIFVVLASGCDLTPSPKKKKADAVSADVYPLVESLKNGGVTAFAKSLHPADQEWSSGQLSRILMLAITEDISHREDVVALVLNAGADPNAVIHGRPLLHWLVSPPSVSRTSVDEEFLCIFRELMSAGASADISDANGHTCLHILALPDPVYKSRGQGVVGLLDLYGASMNAQNSVGETPADLAFLFELDSLRETLESHGGVLSRYSKGGVPRGQALKIAQAEAHKHDWPWVGEALITKAGTVWSIVTNAAGAGMNVTIQVHTRTGVILKSEYNPY